MKAEDVILFVLVASLCAALEKAEASHVPPPIQAPNSRWKCIRAEEQGQKTRDSLDLQPLGCLKQDIFLKFIIIFLVCIYVYEPYRCKSVRAPEEDS